MLAEVQISSASYEDLPEVARIHVAAWKQAYVGQVPKAHLDRVVSRLLVANVEKKAAGFICFGPGRDRDRQDWGEIYAIYVLESYWGGGLGYQLYKHACAELQHNSLMRAYLWVLETNDRAIAAYKRWGGLVEHDRLKDHEIGGHPVKEVSVSFVVGDEQRKLAEC